MKKLLFLSFLICINTAYSAEADNFTARQLNLKDASDEVNSLANRYLHIAVNNLNKSSNCDEAAFYKEMRKYFGNHSNGQLVKDILYKDVAPINILHIKKSVYSTWTSKDGFILGNKKAGLSALALSPLIKIGDEIIGVDKLEHMFGMGYTYFKKYHNKDKEIIDVLKYGIFLEKTILGGNIIATGVFSYADLAANFNGMRFWNHVLQKENDVLGASNNLGPYVTCNDNQWKVNTENPIDFKKYVDSSMDESINCSKFAAEKAVDKFRAQVILKGFVTLTGEASCPVVPEKLQEMRAKYQASGIEHLIINTKGNGQVSYFNEF
jgi:hypothetical protein